VIIRLNFSREKYVTVSQILPCIKGLTKKLNMLSMTLCTAEGKHFLERINFFVKEKLYVYETRSQVKMSTLLDPRFKKKGFRNIADADAMVKHLQYIVSNNMKSGYQEEREICQSLPQSADNLLDFLYEEDEVPGSSSNSNLTSADAIIAVDLYLKSQQLPYNEDPLKFWFERRSSFPHLLPVVLQHLVIPGSSVPCERLFSRAGYIVTKRRNRLKPYNVKMLTILNMNYELVCRFYKRGEEIEGCDEIDLLQNT